MKKIAYFYLLLCMGLSLSFAASADSGDQKMIVTVRGMVCSFCAQGIEKKLKTFKEIKNVEVDLDTKKVVIFLNSGQDFNEDILRQTIKNSGFDVVSVEKKGAP